MHNDRDHVSVAPYGASVGSAAPSPTGVIHSEADGLPEQLSNILGVLQEALSRMVGEPVAAPQPTKTTGSPPLQIGGFMGEHHLRLLILRGIAADALVAARRLNAL